MPLPVPVTAVAVESSEGHMGRAAVASMQGLRSYFEDCYYLDQKLCMCGVFDGHLGDEAAAFCAERLPLHFAAADDAEAVINAFAACDADLKTALPSDSVSGTTATVAKFRQNGNRDIINLVVASCGDSRAVLWRKESDVIEYTLDHRPSDQAERDRIEAAGGHVSEDFDPPRVDGQLACSRALGDFGFKKGPGGNTAQKVTCTPDVYHWTAQRGDWLILASDGIWDTLSNEQVVQHVRTAAEQLGDTVARVLSLCIEKEADDNLTLLAVELGAVPVSKPRTSILAGDFLKAKDPDVLDQYASFCLRFGFKIHRELKPKAPPTISLIETERNPSFPRYPPKTQTINLFPEQPKAKAGRKPLVIVGPSGVGKGTLIQKILESFPGHFGFAVSHTTRKARPGEVHGQAYWFVELEEMKQEVAIPGRFLEHANVHGNLYGTSQAALDAVRGKGQICVLDVDVQGAELIKQIHKAEFNYLFIAPPSLETLEQRLRLRGTETEEKIQTRLGNARGELKFFEENPDFFTSVVVNDDLGASTRKLLDLMRSWYPELVQQVKVTTRRSAQFFVHAARELMADRQNLQEVRFAELQVVGVSHAMPMAAAVCSALRSDGHFLVQVDTSTVEVQDRRSNRPLQMPRLSIRLRRVEDLPIQHP
mmetsp:Transcript_39640/g.88827  ORF Transcript_39640/g.88827 Transcript_39640/m.88827 type:complete len:651 (+) Transcript_39640:43-1995(+)